ncbi:MAG: leucine-rich repeat domain-containing protein [Candidatus Scatosoma sp.]
MVNGVCTVCGEIESTNSNNAPVDYSVFYNLEKLYEQSKALAHPYTKEDFLQFVYDSRFTNLYINGSGNLKATTDDGLVVNLGDVRQEFSKENSSNEIIHEIKIVKGYLSVCQKNGTIETIGHFKELTNETNGIIGFVLNKENQLFVRFENDSIISLGKIADSPTEVDNSVLVHKKHLEAFYVYGVMDLGVENVSLPYTHLGKPIIGIWNNAFSKCQKLRSVIISEGYTIIDSSAFYHCAALKEVTIPASVKTIGDFAFAGCSNLETIYYSGTAAQWAEITIYAGNEYLQTARVICQNNQ